MDLWGNMPSLQQKDNIETSWTDKSNNNKQWCNYTTHFTLSVLEH